MKNRLTENSNFGIAYDTVLANLPTDGKEGNTLANQLSEALFQIADAFEKSGETIQSNPNLATFANFLYDACSSSERVLERMFKAKSEATYQKLLTQLIGAVEWKIKSTTVNTNHSPSFMTYGSIFNAKGPFSATNIAHDNLPLQLVKILEPLDRAFTDIDNEDDSLGAQMYLAINELVDAWFDNGISVSENFDSSPEVVSCANWLYRNLHAKGSKEMFKALAQATTASDYEDALIDIARLVAKRAINKINESPDRSIYQYKGVFEYGKDSAFTRMDDLVDELRDRLSIQDIKAGLHATVFIPIKFTKINSLGKRLGVSYTENNATDLAEAWLNMEVTKAWLVDWNGQFFEIDFADQIEMPWLNETEMYDR